MLFRKKIERACQYCACGTQINDMQFLCKNKGVVPADGKCSRFSYDPCKRVPKKSKALDFSQYDNDDFSL